MCIAFTSGQVCINEKMSVFDGRKARWINFSLGSSELISSFELTILIFILFSNIISDCFILFNLTTNYKKLFKSFSTSSNIQNCSRLRFWEALIRIGQALDRCVFGSVIKSPPARHHYDYYYTYSFSVGTFNWCDSNWRYCNVGLYYKKFYINILNATNTYGR